MKISFYLLLMSIVFCGCNEQQTEQEQPTEEWVNDLEDSRYEILVLDSCEYIVFGWVPRNDHVITHKGNCRFCLERNKK